jgi:ankyrin repeat protein
MSSSEVDLLHRLKLSSFETSRTKAPEIYEDKDEVFLSLRGRIVPVAVRKSLMKRVKTVRIALAVQRLVRDRQTLMVEQADRIGKIAFSQGLITDRRNAITPGSALLLSSSAAAAGAGGAGAGPGSASTPAGPPQAPRFIPVWERTELVVYPPSVLLVWSDTLLAVLEKFWRLVSTNAITKALPGPVKRDEYLAVMRKVYKCLVASYTPEEARLSAMEEWEAEQRLNPGVTTIDFPAFARGFSEIADRWTLSGPVEEQAGLVAYIFHKVAKRRKDGDFKWRHDDEIHCSDNEDDAGRAGLSSEYVITDIFQAIEASSPEDIRRLLNLGASISLRNVDGDTPLHVAAKAGLPMIMSMLLGHPGANVSIPNKRDETPLVCAVRYGLKEVVAVILKAIPDGDDGLDARDAIGRTAIHYAMVNGITDIIAALLRKGSRLSIGDNDGNTALHIAVAKENDVLVELTLKNVKDKADAEVALRSVNRTGLTPRDLAISLGLIDTAKRLNYDFEAALRGDGLDRPAPVISAVSVELIGDAVRVWVTGEHLTKVLYVTLNGVDLREVSALRASKDSTDSTRISFLCKPFPPAPGGWGNDTLVVHGFGGISSLPYTGVFRFSNRPEVTEVTRTGFHGPITANTIIKGMNFAYTPKVFIDGVPAVNITHIDSRTVACFIRAGLSPSIPDGITSVHVEVTGVISAVFKTKITWVKRGKQLANASDGNSDPAEQDPVPRGKGKEAESAAVKQPQQSQQQSRPSPRAVSPRKKPVATPYVTMLIRNGANQLSRRQARRLAMDRLKATTERFLYTARDPESTHERRTFGGGFHLDDDGVHGHAPPPAASPTPQSPSAPVPASPASSSLDRGALTSYLLRCREEAIAYPQTLLVSPRKERRDPASIKMPTPKIPFTTARQRERSASPPASNSNNSNNSPRSLSPHKPGHLHLHTPRSSRPKTSSGNSKEMVLPDLTVPVPIARSRTTFL